MTSPTTYIEVAVALPVYQTFTYSVPQAFLPLVAIGKRVLVPFGQRKVSGYILDHPRDVGSKDIKHIFDVLDEYPLFPPTMLPFFRWIAEYYKHPIGDVIKNALPGGINIYDYAVFSISAEGQSALTRGSVTPLERDVLELLISGTFRLKDLNKQLKQSIPSALIQSLERRGRITQTRMLRGGRTKSRSERFIRPTQSSLPLEGLSPAKKKIMNIIQAKGEIALKEIKASVPSAPKLIRTLELSGYLTILHKRMYRDPFGEAISPDTAPSLNREQRDVVCKICEQLNNDYATFLLQGVTGSGKTEVYMQVAAETLNSGKTVLVLVPEIALITQMERRFRARFGERVAVLHSGLSAGERFDQWSLILQNKADIAIGARSAIFAPFENIGIIIVDEEHDTSYKQEGSLRYNARDLSVVRAKLNGCVAVLGSATPSIQSYFNARREKFIEVNLKKRIEKRPLPGIKVVDLRQSRDARGIRKFITPQLHQAMIETLERKEQVLLFLNRRGFASYPICASCGQPIRCKHCDISLTLHQRANAYRCHYCGFTRSSSSRCPICDSAKIKQLGLGTEKVEQALIGLFPQSNIARMDRDTTRRKGSILSILKGLRNKHIDILIGTQMVAKGHDFPNITLVGIVCADLSLNFPDFRAGERTFQLLAQVAGRAGRGAVPGRVILQTYNPQHFSIMAARDQDFQAFYKQEIIFRKALNYPPLSRMIQLKISGKDSKKTKKHAQFVGDLCRDLQSGQTEFKSHLEILGPIEAPLVRIAEYYRWQILLKSLNAKALHGFVGRLLNESSVCFNNPNAKVVIDVDPVFMM
jgi:primosomal protein N' (replication factor Y)